ncbi:hypothetical protein [Conyzicola sp.]|uniref:hypothetical protein n=1 Tax=Conyzicola sp. TaxID=1969404 RepID=UPI003989F12B
MGNPTYRRAAAIAVAVAVSSALSGCTAAPISTDTVQTAAPTPTSDVTYGMTITQSPTPQEICAELIDVNTLLHNEGVAFVEGRVGQQELRASHQLVGRLVQRIDTSIGTDLSDAVKDMKVAVGEGRPGAPTTFDPATESWSSAFAEAKAECAQAGVEVYAEGWTGG